MRKEVEQLALMGAMPDETDEPTDVLIDKYADLLGKITKPITLDGSAYFNQGSFHLLLYMG